MSKEILIALYENKRLLILNTFLNHPKSVHPALAYAYENRLAPIFHEGIMRESYEEDPFENIYRVSGEFISEVVKYIDDNDRTNTLQNVQFYNLEQHFGGRGDRMHILFAIEYARIDGRFSDNVYQAITSNAPSEASTIESTFEPKNVYISQ